MVTDITVHTSAEPDLLSATLRATWPDGVCTDTVTAPSGCASIAIVTA